MRGCISFPIGIVLADIYKGQLSEGERRNRKMLTLFVLISILGLFYILAPGKHYELDYVVVLGLFPLLIYCVLGKNNWLGRILASKPFVFLGNISYSIFLVHFPVGAIIRNLIYDGILENIFPVLGYIYIILVLILSVVISKYIERPGKKWFISIAKRS